MKDAVTLPPSPPLEVRSWHRSTDPVMARLEAARDEAVVTAPDLTTEGTTQLAHRIIAHAHLLYGPMLDPRGERQALERIGALAAVALDNLRRRL